MSLYLLMWMSYGAMMYGGYERNWWLVVPCFISGTVAAALT